MEGYALASQGLRHDRRRPDGTSWGTHVKAGDDHDFIYVVVLYIFYDG